MAISTLLDSTATYSSIISNTADYILTILSSKSSTISKDDEFRTIKDSTVIVKETIQQITNTDGTSVENFNVPNKDKIVNDIKNFLIQSKIMTSELYSKVPTNSGFLALIFALDTFIKDSIGTLIKKIDSDDTNTSILYYNPKKSCSQYININPIDDNTITTDKINELYNEITIVDSSLDKGNVYLQSSTTSSSCSSSSSSSSSSSCSSSSSSWFIAFLNLQ